eukprot:jgi/Ulvmu1/9059/UM005_0152.1
MTIMEVGATADASSGREDGRGPEELRPHIFQKTGMLTRSSGSAYLEIGSTKVTVAVHGPRPPDSRADFSVQGALNVTVKYAPFSGAPAAKRKGPNELELHMRGEVEQALRAVLLLDRYPKATVDVHCLVLERGGSEGAALLMAASLAAIDAGLECRCVLSAANLIMTGPMLLVDPTAAEEAVAERSALVAMDASRQLIAHMSVGGVFSAAELKDVLGLALSACEFYDDGLKATLRADLTARRA